MQLRRIEIRDFKKLDHAVIEDIGDGLTVIVGDNEAGKSTILSALRAVLFERHRVTGGVVERMLPYGQSVRPEVTIEFDLKGERWRLRKAFNQRPEAELSGPAKTRMTGDAVEDKLAELFGFTPPARGESKRDEHQGLYGLLWVDQGRSHQSLGVGGGKETLASALESEVGQLVGGERGRALLAAASERRDAFWGKNDRARGAYKQLGDALAAAELRRAALVESLRQHDDKVAALASRQDALSRHARDERLAKASRFVSTTREDLSRAESLERTLAEAGHRLSACQKDQALASEYRRRRGEMIGKVETADLELARTTRGLDEARMILARRQALAEAAEKRRDAERDRRNQADAVLRAAEEATLRQGRLDVLKRLEDQHRQGEAVAGRQREALAVAAAVSLSAKDVADLDRLQKAVDLSQSELRAASVQITFEPADAQGVAVDGIPLPPGEDLRLSQDATITLEGFGRILLRPGGGTGALVRAADDARRRLDEALSRHGYRDGGMARTALARKTEAEHEAKAQGALLAAVAPQGLEALRQAIETERRGVAMLALPEAGTAPAVDRPIEELRQERDGAIERERGAEADAKAAVMDRDHVAREVAVLAERAANAGTLQATSVAELASSRLQAGDDLLREKLLDAEQATATATAAAGRAAADLAGADVATARLDHERAVQAERTIRTDIEKLTSEKRDLEVELNVLGRAGLGEDLAETEGQIERLTREKAAQDLEATASRLLLQTLSEAQQDAKDRWLGPVRDRIRPYLRFIEPDSDIILNDQSLEIEGLMRRGIREPFASLSVGAREQVAVITRLALADILRASGTPSALILDDALVNTDEGRLERMHRVLQTAAKSLQVLVLTCRERDFVGLGDLKRL